MKKLLSFIIVMCIIITAVPINASAVSVCTPYNGDNLEAQNYEIATSTIKSYFTKCSDGKLMRVQVGKNRSDVFVEYYDTSYNLLSSMVLPQELPVFGGFYESASNYFLVTGQTNKAELSTTEVYRLTKYDKNWNRISSVGVYGSNTTIPFNAGAVRFVMSGNVMIMYTSHEMYTTPDGKNHQANVIISVDTSTMKIIKCQTEIANSTKGYISHSFNQFIQLQGKNIVAVDHGDANPRSIVLIQHSGDATTGDFGNNCKLTDILTFPGESGDNYTGASIGGFEISSTSYLIAGNTVEQDDNYPNNKTRNIFVASITDSQIKTNKITNYAEGEATTSTPHLVKIATDKYMLMWSRSNVVYYTTIDGKGNQTSSIYSMDGNLSDCVPIIINNKLVWYVWKDTKSIFYEINLNSLSQTSSKISDTGHKYEVIGLNDGVSTVECTHCGDINTFSVPDTMSVWWKTANSIDTSYFPMIDGKLIVGETLNLMVKFAPFDENINTEFEVIVSDESILKYEQKSLYSGQILGDFSLLKPGKATITIKHRYNPALIASYTVAVNSNIDHEYEVVSVDNGVSTVKCINCGETYTFDVPTTMKVWWNTASNDVGAYYSGINGDLISGETLKIMVKFTPFDEYINNDFEVIVSDESIIKYQQRSVYAGQLLGDFNLLKPGKATITIRHKYNPSLTATYNVTVKSNVAHEYEFISTSNGVSTVRCINCGENNTIEVPTTMSVWWKTASNTGNSYYSGIKGDLISGETLKTMIAFSPTDTDVNKEFEVVVSDESILKYEQKSLYSDQVLGDFSLLKPGEATITIKHKYNPSLTATYNVTVKSNATAVSLDKSSLEMITDETYTLTPTFTPVDASALCSWSSSNPDVATVDSNGTITAKTAGTAVITLTLDNNLKATCTVTVKNSFISGDINLDGEVNVTDVIMLLRSYISDLTLSAKQIEAADMDNSGDLTVLDAILIQKQILDMA
ncbi:MAG: Ig-like domain-containing protein [Acutalibacteraceae bacterium]|nr:Ig-like domain-containing protein [Acutalibacteraceae bacterium]